MALTDVLPERRWAHWPRDTQSPYYHLFYGAMSAHGVIPVSQWNPSDEWLATSAADAIHVHWPDSLWRQRGKGTLARARGVWELRTFLARARQCRIRVIWTVHNHHAHERSDWVDDRGYAVLAGQSDLLICHTRWSADVVAKIYRPSGTIVVMPHGNFEGVFPAPRTREAVLRDLGLDPARPVVSSLGHLRAYKGLELVCAAVARFNGRIQLVIGGPRVRYDVEPLRRAVAALPGAVLLERRLTDQEYADFTAASDVSVLSYSSVTTSGVLVASWTLGTGVIASDLPPFRELIPQPTEAGRLVRPGDVDDLAKAIETYLSLSRAVRTRGAMLEAQKYAWPTCVAPVAEWLRRAC